MKILFLIFPLLFLFSATNDCCLTEVQEELVKTASVSHSHDTSTEHEEREDINCPECFCSTFCSYNLLVDKPSIYLNFSQTVKYLKFPPALADKEASYPLLIFHPPIV
jgi:hypothetical protein